MPGKRSGLDHVLRGATEKFKLLSSISHPRTPTVVGLLAGNPESSGLLTDTESGTNNAPFYYKILLQNHKHVIL